MTTELPAGMAERVRRHLATERVEATPAAVVSAVQSKPEHAVLGDTTVLRLAGQVHDELVGAGPLAPLLADESVTDILVNGVEVWVDRGAGLQRCDVRVGAPDDVCRLAQRLAAACGRRLDDGQPFADARLSDGTRLHAVLPPIAADGPYLSLRTFRQRPFTLDDLVSDRTVTPEIAPLLSAIVAARLAYLVTGGTGSGKTTVLGTLLGLVPPTERIVLVEDAAELRPTHPHVVALQARTANVEGAGAVGLTDLVRQALRMRPDRLVIGECRGAEIVDLLGALNTGHDGGAGTLHANAPADVPARLEALGLLGGLPRAALHAQVVAALQVILQVRRTIAGRYLDSVSVLLPAGPDRLATVVPAWHRTQGRGPAAEALAQLLTTRGVPVPPILTVPEAAAAPPVVVVPGANAEQGGARSGRPHPDALSGKERLSGSRTRGIEAASSVARTATAPQRPGPSASRPVTPSGSGLDGGGHRAGDGRRLRHAWADLVEPNDATAQTAVPDAVSGRRMVTGVANLAAAWVDRPQKPPTAPVRTGKEAEIGRAPRDRKRGGLHRASAGKGRPGTPGTPGRVERPPAAPGRVERPLAVPGRVERPIHDISRLEVLGGPRS